MDHRNPEGYAAIAILRCRRQPRVSYANHLFTQQIACSANHTLALVRDENQVYSWGCGDGGRLGHGDADDRCVHRAYR
jgi:alpha-tubulin suppressor-like RCC1 family protein